MRIAILGATSQIAKDLVQSFSVDGVHQLTLFARRPELVEQWLSEMGLSNRHSVSGFDNFPYALAFDAVANFVGVGNPANALAMGASIFDVTYQFDQLALDYLRLHPDCRYIFLSSGAAFGTSFLKPVSQDTEAVIPLNSVGAKDWYGVSKMHAECRHRSLSHLAISDIRVFNYFSRSQDLSARFLISDILRAIRHDSVLRTSADPIVRDFLHPVDFHHLIEKVLVAPASNSALDCYSRAPISKQMLLKFMGERFGLRFEVVESAGVNATGSKANYYSINKQAHQIGYEPRYSSIDGIEVEAAAILEA